VVRAVVLESVVFELDVVEVVVALDCVDDVAVAADDDCEVAVVGMLDDDRAADNAAGSPD
jgi:hypothetical protein